MERRKLPVFKTVGRAYGFFFKKFFSILRVGWFGIVFLSLLMLGAIYYNANPDLLKSTLWVGSYFVGQVAGVIVGIVVMVGLFRVYFDLPREQGWIYFTIDIAFWRFVAAYVLQYIIFVMWTALFIFVELVAAQLISGVGFSLLLKDAQAYGEALSPFAIAFLSIGFIVFIIGYFLIAVRLQLFYPIIVVEQRLGLRRSWVLTRKNFWRLIGGSIVLSISISLFGILLLLLVMIPFALSGVTIKSMNAISMNWMNSSILLVFGSLIFMVAQVFLFSVIVGFSSAAYEALKPEEESSQILDGKEPVIA